VCLYLGRNNTAEYKIHECIVLADILYLLVLFYTLVAGTVHPELFCSSSNSFFNFFWWKFCVFNPMEKGALWNEVWLHCLLFSYIFCCVLGVFFVLLAPLRKQQTVLCHPRWRLPRDPHSLPQAGEEPNFEPEGAGSEPEEPVRSRKSRIGAGFELGNRGAFSNPGKM
jgi:hypothetical protein